MTVASLLFVGAAEAVTINTNGTQLNFSNGTTQLGTNAPVGTSLTYAQVIPGVDAKFTYVSRSDASHVFVNYMDYQSSGAIIDFKFETPVNATTFCGTCLTGASAVGYSVNLRVEFFAAGTNNPVSLSGLSTYVKDIDLKQTASFTGASRMNLSSATGLTPSRVGNVLIASDVIGVNNPTVSNLNYIAEWNFDSPMQSLDFSLGSGTSGGNGYEIAFTSAPWTSTPTTTYTPPIAVDEALSTAYQTAINGAVGTNDTAPVGSTFTKTTDPTNGTVIWNSDGTYTYTPNNGWSGVDTFTYTVTNAAGSSTATETITVLASGAPAVLAVNDNYTTPFNTPVSGSAVTGDTVPAGSVFTKTTDPTHGTVVWNADGTYTYTPTAGYSGTDSFTYTVTSGGVSSTATETITIQAQSSQQNSQQNTTPTVLAVNDSFNTALNTPVSCSAATGDTAPSGSVFAQTSQSTHGTVTWNADGTYLYTPNIGYTGTDSFTYSVTSGGVTSSATETITISAANSGNAAPVSLVHTGVNGAGTIVTAMGALAAVSVGMFLVAFSIIRRRTI